MAHEQRHLKAAGKVVALLADGHVGALHLIADALAEAEAAQRERDIEACRKAVPPAHTYASENADVYRAWGRARDACIAAIRGQR